MKRTAISVGLLLCILLLCVSIVSFAEESRGLPYYVSDVAGLLSEEERSALEESAKRASDAWSCGIYVVTLDDYRRYAEGSESSFLRFSESFYHQYNMGIGSGHDGILLIMSMDDSDYSLIAYGDRANYSFTDYGKNALEKEFLPYLSRGQWYNAFSAYISGCDSMLKRAAEGAPVDVPAATQAGSSSQSGPSGIHLLITLLFPAGISFSVCQGMKRSMKQVRQKRTAEEYILPGGVHMTVQQDTFLNRTVVRTPIPRVEKTSGPSGHGGTSVRPSGFSGHSGKF